MVVGVRPPLVYWECPVCWQLITRYNIDCSIAAHLQSVWMVILLIQPDNKVFTADCSLDPGFVSRKIFTIDREEARSGGRGGQVRRATSWHLWLTTPRHTADCLASWPGYTAPSSLPLLQSDKVSHPRGFYNTSQQCKPWSKSGFLTSFNHFSYFSFSQKLISLISILWRDSEIRIRNWNIVWCPWRLWRWKKILYLSSWLEHGTLTVDWVSGPLPSSPPAHVHQLPLSQRIKQLVF